MADGAAKPEPEKKSWADVEEEEEAKAKAEAEADLAAAAAASSSSAAPTEPEVEAQAKQIEALSLSVPDDDGGGPEGPPLLDDSDDSQIQAVTSGDTVYESATTFEELNLTSELLKGLHDEMGFSRPSKIQAITLPMILTPPYKDLVAQAHNGSGKTTCFVLGMLSRVDPNRKVPQAICICPTRELAQQNKSVLMRMGKFTGITCACAIPPAQKDYVPISRMAPVTDQVVIGTSGTLMKWISNKKLSTRDIKILVFDEADHMLAEEGFKTDSDKIMKDLKRKDAGCQVLLFSATFNEKVKDFVTRVIKDGNQIFVKKEDLTLEKVKQYKVRVPDEAAKIEVIRDKIFEFGQKVGQVIIFVRTKISTKNVHNALTREDYVCSSIQGSLDQSEREKVIQEFKDGYTKVLISTDVLARGFDQAQVNLVINYDMPIKFNTRDEPDYEVYLHRIGRAGRFGRKEISRTWTADGTYMASSCYLATFHGSTSCQSWKLIWKTWAPPRVKFFHWLANQDRCWTAERLARHGLQHHPRCLLCDQEPETIQHLLLTCPFVRQTWHEILAWLRMTAAAPSQEASLMEWWKKARKDTPKQLQSALASTALLIPWMTWKHRNDCVFNGAQPSLTSLAAKIKEELNLWARAGAKGLRVVLPSSWDVH